MGAVERKSAMKTTVIEEHFITRMYRQKVAANPSPALIAAMPHLLPLIWIKPRTADRRDSGG
jgi:hypothetical protein